MTVEENATRASCPNKTGCRLYPQFTLQSMLRLWQDSFCNGDFDSCERYQRSARLEPVPDNLLPNGKFLASK
jgi:hypothetical protein